MPLAADVGSGVWGVAVGGLVQLGMVGGADSSAEAVGSPVGPALPIGSIDGDAGVGELAQAPTRAAQINAGAIDRSSMPAS